MAIRPCPRDSRLGLKRRIRNPIPHNRTGLSEQRRGYTDSTFMPDGRRHSRKGRVHHPHNMGKLNTIGQKRPTAVDRIDSACSAASHRKTSRQTVTRKSGTPSGIMPWPHGTIRKPNRPPIPPTCRAGSRRSRRESGPRRPRAAPWGRRRGSGLRPTPTRSGPTS